ncbi:uncharacterized protein LOC131881212 [Tigriopus californicus]|uniref:uncharacterized protein LOC131881212 n=1 Tax=Tigriopus californicus TaxID=6832 RepID=UPI0027DA1E25|nr:uncharacterized protein LOC131881212 [Tigriopus californicus]
MGKLVLIFSILFMTSSTFVQADDHVNVGCEDEDLLVNSSIAAFSGEPRSGRHKRYWLLWCMNFPDCCDIKGEDTCGFACPGCPKKYKSNTKSTSTTPSPPQLPGGLAALRAQRAPGSEGAGTTLQGGGLAALLAQEAAGGGGGSAPQGGGLAALLAQGATSGGGGSAPQDGGLAALLAQAEGGSAGGTPQGRGLAALLAQGASGGSGGNTPQGEGLAALLGQGPASGGGGTPQGGGLAALLAQGGAGGGGTSQVGEVKEQLSTDLEHAAWKISPTHVTLPLSHSSNSYQPVKSNTMVQMGNKISKEKRFPIFDLGTKNLASGEPFDQHSKTSANLSASASQFGELERLPSTDLSTLFAKFGANSSNNPGQTPSLAATSSLASQFIRNGASDLQTSEGETSSPSLSPLLALAAQGGLPNGVEVGPLGIDIFANEELDVAGFGDYDYEDYEDEDGTIPQRRYWRKYFEKDLPLRIDSKKTLPSEPNPNEYDTLSAPMESTIQIGQQTYTDTLTPAESNYLFSQYNPSSMKRSSGSWWTKIKSNWDKVQQMWSY